MSGFIHFPSFLIFLTLVVVLGGVATVTIGLSFWVSVAIVAFAILINGALLLFERDRPKDDVNKPG